MLLTRSGRCKAAGAPSLLSVAPSAAPRSGAGLGGAALGAVLGCGFSILWRVSQPRPRVGSDGNHAREPVSAACAPSAAMTNFLAGLVAGIAVDVPLHPLDTLKTRLQAPGGFAASPGFHKLWSGLTPVLLRSLPCSAIFFVTYDYIGQVVERQVPSAQGSAWRDAFAGSAANVAACSVRVPCEVLKQRMQAGTASGEAATLRATAHSLYRGGIRCCYMGFGATVARELAFAAVQMPLFERLKRHSAWSDDRSAHRGLVGALAGGLSGAAAGAVTTPLDVAKTRQMLAPKPSGCHGILATLAETRADGGVKALFRGLVARTSYVGVSCALSFGAFEWSRSLLTKL